MEQGRDFRQLGVHKADIPINTRSYESQMVWMHIPDSNFSPLSHPIHPRYLHLMQTSASAYQFSSVLGLFQLTISIASPLHYCNAAFPIPIRSKPGHHARKNYAPRRSGTTKPLLEQTINIQSRKTSCSAPLTSHASTTPSPTPSNPLVSPSPPPSQPSTPPFSTSVFFSACRSRSLAAPIFA